jgi:hypothetical protein
MIINKLAVKNLLEFRRYSEQQQSNFAVRLKNSKIIAKNDSSGGDYWRRSISEINVSFRLNDNKIVAERLDSLINDHNSTPHDNTKKMYKRNIDVLQGFESFDFSIWRPNADLNFHSKPKHPLNVKNVPLHIIPNHVFPIR